VLRSAVGQLLVLLLRPMPFHQTKFKMADESNTIEDTRKNVICIKFAYLKISKVYSEGSPFVGVTS